MFFYDIALFTFFLACGQSVVEFTLIIPFTKEDCQTQLHFGIFGPLNLCILIAVKPLTDIDAIDAFYFCSPIFLEFLEAPPLLMLDGFSRIHQKARGVVPYHRTLCPRTEAY